jgi:hypothetical protein
MTDKLFWRNARKKYTKNRNCPTISEQREYKLVSDAFGGIERVLLKNVCEDTAITIFSRLLLGEDSNLSHQEAALDL